MTAGRPPLNPDDRFEFHGLSARITTVRKFKEICKTNGWHPGEKLDEIITAFIEGRARADELISSKEFFAEVERAVDNSIEMFWIQDEYNTLWEWANLLDLPWGEPYAEH